MFVHSNQKVVNIYSYAPYIPGRSPGYSNAWIRTIDNANRHVFPKKVGSQILGHLSSSTLKLQQVLKIEKLKYSSLQN